MPSLRLKESGEGILSPKATQIVTGSGEGEIALAGRDDYCNKKC